MARFRFRLAALMKVRQAERRRRREELALAQHAEAMLTEHMEQLDREQAALRQRCRQTTAPGTVDVEDLLAAHRYALVLKSRSKQLALKRQELQQEIARRRQALVEADREVKVLENLRQRQWDQYQLEQQRLESKQLDEIAQQASQRESRS